MKISWIRPILVGILLLMVIAGIYHVVERLPPSKVNLVFKGWRKAGTNSYAIFDLTNAGPRSIYWNLDGSTILETESGWITNRFEHFTYETLGTLPGSNEIVAARIPIEARSWMIRVDYSSFQRHQLRMEAYQHLATSGMAEHVPEFVYRALNWVAEVGPKSQEEYHETFSEIFTNKPPDDFVDSTKSR
jgi:hypothetical protein